jgi:hypothetical protein
MLARFGTPLPLEDLSAGARFLWALPGLLRHPLGRDEARSILRARLARREHDFLTLVRRTIYAQPISPYRQLLRLAGCETGDLERLVGAEGVEGALHRLYRDGVYLTVDELRGRRPAVRGSQTLWVEPRQLRNPLSAVHVPTRSGGARSDGLSVPIDLRSVRDWAVNHQLVLDARAGDRWLHAVWQVPGSAAMIELMRYAVAGGRPARWFSQVDPDGPGQPARYRWSARALASGSLLAGVPIPYPSHVPWADPRPILAWIAEARRGGQVPHLRTNASSAVRLCEAAAVAGTDLRGAQFTLGGEPVTTARLAAVRRAGAGALPHFGTTECATIGQGCLTPTAADDLHLFHDLHAVIQPGPNIPGSPFPPDALLFASLRPTAPLILLNASLGDRGVVAPRACGCPLERLGWTTHLRDIRSFEKLTAGGMTFLDSDLIRVLEEALPASFGGGPTDYQLLETEAEDGRPQVRLLVNPAVGAVDDAAVTDAFLSAIGAGGGAERVMALHWREAGLLRVERRPPLATATGKILHLHQERGDQSSGAYATESRRSDLRRMSR